MAACALILFGSIEPALAHGRSTPVGATSGVSIPNLSHGQMQVIAENQSAIMQLAEQQSPVDATMQRLQSYAIMQRFVCAWGIIPGSVNNDSSPFNECGHAYLAATRSLLIYLQTMPGHTKAKAALINKIETEMLLRNASLVLCRYSDEPFNTADYITPHVGPIPVDPISVSKMAAGFLVLGWLVMLVVRRRTRSRGMSLEPTPS